LRLQIWNMKLTSHTNGSKVVTFVLKWRTFGDAKIWKFPETHCVPKNIPQHLSIHSRLLLQNTSTFTTRRKSDSVQNVHSLIACTCHCLAVIWTMYLLIEFSSFNMATVHSLWQRCVHMAIYGKSDLHSYSSVRYSVFPTLHKLSVKFHLQQCSNSGGYHENCMQKTGDQSRLSPNPNYCWGHEMTPLMYTKPNVQKHRSIHSTVHDAVPVSNLASECQIHLEVSYGSSRT